jgi:hypothetical protein
MISIITCSVDKKYLSKFIISIEKTIDIEHEIIVIDNQIEKLSIAKAYNIGAKKAKYSYLVFVHEDVEFLNNNWASNIMKILQNPEVGIVGLAGSTYLPSSPSTWYLPDEAFNNVFIHQGFKHSGKSTRFDNQGKDLTSVFLLDGVFLAMRKEVHNEYSFNENLAGFHAYDVDICHRVIKKYKNIFTNQVELIHHSEGVPGKEIDKSYFDLIIECKRNYHKFNYGTREYTIEFEIMKQLYSHLLTYYSRSEILILLNPFITIKNLGFKHFFRFKKLLKK